MDVSDKIGEIAIINPIFLGNGIKVRAPLTWSNGATLWRLPELQAENFSLLGPGEKN